MEIKALYFNPLRECSYVVWDETLECVIIDPGCYGGSEFSRLESFISDNGLRPVGILLTHGHFDHIFGLARAAKVWKVKVFIHPEDIWQVGIGAEWCESLGLELEPYEGPFEEIRQGSRITFGTCALEVIETPGHTRGCVCFHSPEEGVIFTGDTLFRGSIGRTDHPRGDTDTLLASLQKLKSLPDGTRVLAGHGYPTTIGEEKASNPYLATDGR